MTERLAVSRAEPSACSAHKRTLPSSPALASCLPSGLKATLYTQC